MNWRESVYACRDMLCRAHGARSLSSQPVATAVLRLLKSRPDSLVWTCRCRFVTDIAASCRIIDNNNNNDNNILLMFICVNRVYDYRQPLIG